MRPWRRQRLSVTGEFQFRSADAQAEVAGEVTHLKRCFAVGTGEDLWAELHKQTQVMKW